MRPFRADILEEHLEEAAFLYRLRERAFEAFARRLESLGELEERLLAHLDGLIAAGPEGWNLASGALASKDPGQSFAAACTALALDAAEPRAALAEALAGGADLEGALRLAPGDASVAALRDLTQHPSIEVRAAVWSALVFRKQTGSVDELPAYLASDSLPVLRSGLEIAARLRPSNAAPAVTRGLASDHPPVLRSALRAGMFLGLPEAHAAGRELGTSGGPNAHAALHWLAMAGGADVHGVLVQALEQAPTRRTALLALGRHGHPAAVAPLVDATADPAGARAAGHALELLLGVDLKAEGLTLPPDAAPEVEDLDADDDLPWPDPEKTRAWWASLAAEEDASKRRRGGRPLTWKQLLKDAEDAPVPLRETAILECRLRLPGITPLETRGWVQDQRRALPQLAQEVEAAARGRQARDWPTLLPAQAGRN